MNITIFFSVMSYVTLVLILLFLIYNRKRKEPKFKVEEHPKPTVEIIESSVSIKKPEHVIIAEVSNPHIPPYMLHYQIGAKATYTVIKLALFRMSQNGDLFGFDSIISTMDNYMLEFQNEKVLREWDAKLEEYIKTKQ